VTDRPTVLLPVRVLERESIPDGIPELLANAHVVLLGYHVVPDQTATGQASMQFEDRARRRLETFEELFADAGATVETQLVFTHHGQATIHRTIREHDCHAALIPNATKPPEDVLVAVRGTVGLDRVARVVGGLFADTEVELTLYHVLEDGETEADARTLLDGLADRLVDEGVGADEIDVRVTDRRDRRAAIAEATDEFDAVVLGESDPSVATFVFGMRAQQIAERFLGPVFVVQRERPTDAKSGESGE